MPRVREPGDAWAWERGRREMGEHVPNTIGARPERYRGGSVDERGRHTFAVRAVSRSSRNLRVGLKVATRRLLVRIVSRPTVVRVPKPSWGVFLLLSAVLTSPVAAQELDCRVQIDVSQISGAESEYAFLDDLERKIQEYMNTRSWTDDQFLQFERISCSMQIVVLEAISISEFRARLIVTTRRPIYGTSQSSLIMRVNDPEWRFEFSRGSSLNYDLDRYNSLTSVLDFYAYLMLGYDYDTFSALGGTPYFERARTVADQAEGTGDPGWSTVGTQQNRVQLLSNLLGQRHQPLRRVYYNYHRKGLDRFVGETTAARQQVLSVLKILQKLNRQLSRSFALNLFFQTKYQELTALFADSDLASQAQGLLVQMDPAHSSEYKKLAQ